MVFFSHLKNVEMGGGEEGDEESAWSKAQSVKMECLLVLTSDLRIFQDFIGLPGDSCYEHFQCVSLEILEKKCSVLSHSPSNLSCINFYHSVVTPKIQVVKLFSFSF